MKDTKTHVARPARISVKKREPFRSLRAPENSRRKNRPIGLAATRLFKRSVKVIVEASEQRRRSGEIGVGDGPRYMYHSDTQSRFDVGRRMG
jgi:hypothetical protein